MKRHKFSAAGFTLVETAMVIVIGGIMMLAALVMFSDYLLTSKQQTTQSRMKDIDNAIVQYLNVNGVLPCVADLKEPPGTAKFGQQINDANFYPVSPAPGDCEAAFVNGNANPGGAFKKLGVVPPVTPDRTNTTGFVIEGAVPIRALGLPDAEMSDAWGDRFIYAVTNTLTDAGPPSLYGQSQGSITVYDSTAKEVAVLKGRATGPAQYVLISLGADRAGAYTTNGGLTGTPCPAVGVTETLNCDYLAPGSAFRKTMLNSNQTGAANFYDDYVIYHTQVSAAGTVPSGFVAPFYLATTAILPGTPPPAFPVATRNALKKFCPAGWKFYNPTALGGLTACSGGMNEADPGRYPGEYDYICCQKN